MAEMIPGDLDWSAYERETEVKVKVRAASIFAEELEREFAPPERRVKHARMISTKLRNFLEFRPGEVTVWAGYNGHRKSMFTGQVAMDLCAQRQRTLLASFEMAPARTLARMARQCFATGTLARDSVQTFSRWTDGRLWIFDHMGRIEPKQAMAVLRYFASELGGQQVMLDSMMMICASEEHLDEQKQFVTDLVRIAQETQLHVHLVAHCRKPQQGEDKPPTKYDLRGSAAISDQVHNVITVWANKAKAAALDKDPNDEQALAKPDAAVTVEKQRNGAWEGRLALWFAEESLRFTDSRMQPVDPYTLYDEEI